MSDSFRPRRRRSAPRFCAFCVNREAVIDYKQPEGLRRYIFGRGKIRPRRQTGLCAKHQRKLAREIKRSRHIALLSFTGDQHR